MATLTTTKSLISPNPNLTFHPTKQSLLLSPNRISLSLHKNSNSKILSTKTPIIVSTNKIQSTIFSDSTRTISTLAALSFALIRKFSAQITHPNVINTVGPLFFASVRSRPVGYLNTPLTVVAAGLSKWLDIYSGVLMVRVLLSWFPNIPWERQPLSAIRDLCDPYLNLFRNIIPPIFDTLDVSPLLAFAVLGTLGSILK